VALLLLAFGGFAALGSWQVERRAWKLDLIARVERRVHAAAVAAPDPRDWPHLTSANAEYRRVRVTGRYLADTTTLVQASTALGPGFWVLTALRQPDGSAVLINRGFIASDRRDRLAPSGDGPVTVTGLLRMTEPGGAFLRHNDPAADRWYSRDVQAIAAAHGLGRTAPWFIDADAAPHATPDAPIGGLTAVDFPNNHLVYAITWYTLALMVAAAGWRAAREERRAEPE
jgi:surfeit locus 1 family protein